MHMKDEKWLDRLLFPQALCLWQLAAVPNGNGQRTAALGRTPGQAAAPAGKANPRRADAVPVASPWIRSGPVPACMDTWRVGGSQPSRECVGCASSGGGAAVLGPLGGYRRRHATEQPPEGKRTGVPQSKAQGTGRERRGNETEQSGTSACGTLRSGQRRWTPATAQGRYRQTGGSREWWRMASGRSQQPAKNGPSVAGLERARPGARVPGASPAPMV